MLSPHYGQQLIHYYSAISLASPQTALQPAKHTDKQMAVLVSLTLGHTKGKQGEELGCEGWFCDSC